MVYFTQQYDAVDKKIRDITSELWFVQKIAWFSCAKRIWRVLEINEQTKEIVQGYRFSNLIELLFMRPRKWCFRPSWYRYFDSFVVDPLPEYSFGSWDDGSA